MTADPAVELPWYAVHANLVLLTRYLADGGWEAETIADAVEKPWKYEPEYRAARAVADHEHAHPRHHVEWLSHQGANAWYCTAGDDGCDWAYPPTEGATP